MKAETVGPEQSLEAMLAELEKIAATLEGGDQPLEQALQLFENGIRLARTGQKRIEAAEARIEILLGAGTAQETVKPFDDSREARIASESAKADDSREARIASGVGRPTVRPAQVSSPMMGDNPPPIEEDDLPF